MEGTRPRGRRRASSGDGKSREPWEGAESRNHGSIDLETQMVTGGGVMKKNWIFLGGISSWATNYLCSTRNTSLVTRIFFLTQSFSFL